MSIFAELILGGAQLLGPLFTPNLTKCKKDCETKFTQGDPRLTPCYGWCKTHKSNGKAPDRKYFQYILNDEIGQAILNTEEGKDPRNVLAAVANELNPSQPQTNASNTIIYAVGAILIIAASIFLIYQIQKNKSK